MISASQHAASATLRGVRSRQRGIALPLVVVGLVAIIAMAGLAIDSSHAFVNKTRMQNMADAAALAAAKEYDETGDTILATVAANGNFGRNTNGSGNFEIDAEYDAGNISVVVQYSETLNPFVSSGIGPYVRVIASGFNMGTGLASIVGINSINIGASAVAGPSPTIDYACNIAPMVACATNPADLDEYGFPVDSLVVLKPEPGNHADVGPGNYKLLRLDPDSPGGASVRENMAGAFEGCAAIEDTVETEPGVTVGPTAQGFNTRFGVYNGPTSRDEYPPDVVTQQHENGMRLETLELQIPADSGNYQEWICLGDCTCSGGACDEFTVPPDNRREFATEDGIFDYWNDYMPMTEGPPALHNESDGVPYRRVLAMPVANCTGNDNGQSTLDIIGFACYFMLQQIGQGGDAEIYGQFVEGCLAGGTSGMDPGDTPGPYVIQLYKDPDSEDS